MINEKIVILISSFGALNYLVLFGSGTDLISSFAFPEMLEQAVYLLFAVAGIFLMVTRFLRSDSGGVTV